MPYWAGASRPSVCLKHKEFSLEFGLLELKMLHSLSFKNPDSWPWQGVNTQSTLIRVTGTSNQKKLGWKAYENLIFLLQLHLARPSETRMFFYCINVLLRMGQTVLVMEQQLSVLSFVAFHKPTFFICSGKMPTSWHLYLPSDFALMYVQWNSCVCVCDVMLSHIIVFLLHKKYYNSYTKTKELSKLLELWIP